MAISEKRTTERGEMKDKSEEVKKIIVEICPATLNEDYYNEIVTKAAKRICQLFYLFEPKWYRFDESKGVNDGQD